MNLRPKISIVIPTLNQEKTIEKLLISLMKINYNKYEIIMVDSSKDNTPVIAKKYNINTIRCEKRGLNIARNIGINNATGEIITFIDGDCEVKPNMLTNIANIFNINDKIACVGGNVVFNTNDLVSKYQDKTLLSLYPKFKNTSYIKGIKDINNIDLTKKRLPVGSNLSIKKEILDKTNMFSSNWKYSYDEFELLHKILKKDYWICTTEKIDVYNYGLYGLADMLDKYRFYGRGARFFYENNTKTLHNNRKKQKSKLIIDSLKTYKKNFIGKEKFILLPILDLLSGINYFLGFYVKI